MLQKGLERKPHRAGTEEIQHEGPLKERPDPVMLRLTSEIPDQVFEVLPAFDGTAPHRLERHAGPRTDAAMPPAGAGCRLISQVDGEVNVVIDHAKQDEV